MEDRLRCANTSCPWCKCGRCRLFVGVTALECQYRIEPTKTRKAKGKNHENKGK